MSRSNYKTIFRLKVCHSYFSNGICKDLVFVPGSSTRKLLERYRFDFKKLPDGFECFINTTYSPQAFLNSITCATGKTYFDFDIETTNSFYNYTNLSTSNLNQLVYSSSNIISNNESYIINAETAEETGNCFAKLKIFFNDILKLMSSELPALLSIHFEARATQWQYYIINRSEVPLKNPAVSDKTGISFSGPENVTMPTGEKALLFTSGTTLLPLKEDSNYRFNLINISGSTAYATMKPTEKIIYKNLPNPNPDTMGFTNPDIANMLSSPMFVYL